MRRITIRFELPSEHEEVYREVHSELVVEDFFTPQLGFEIVKDVDSELGPFGCLCKDWHHKMCGDGCEICNPFLLQEEKPYWVGVDFDGSLVSLDRDWETSKRS